VPFAILEAISDTSEEALRQGLGRLLASEFLYETALFPELEYTFKHALTQEVAYGGLLHERRRDLHARIVRAFERLYPGRSGEQTSWLTLHAFRGEVWDRAVAYLRGSELPTLDGYLSGFTGVDNPGAAWWMADHEHAIRAAHRELGAFPAMFGWNFSLGVVMNIRLGQAHHSLGQYSRAVDCLRRNVELVSGDLLHDHCSMDALPSVFSRVWLALCLGDRGEFEEGLALGEEGLRIAETGDPGFSFVLGCAGLGNVCVAKGDFDRAIAVLERGLAREPDELSKKAWPFVASALGAAYAHVGRLAEALPLLEEAVGRAAAMKLKANQSIRLARLAEAHVRASRPESAFPLAAQALDLAQEHRERGHEAHIIRLLASIEVGREAPALERAEEGYRKALVVAEQLGMRPLQAHCHLGLGRLHQRMGHAEAAAEVGVARALYRAMDMTFWLHEAE
jgi:tetratricopeptide (TPR) repeat protein